MKLIKVVISILALTAVAPEIAAACTPTGFVRDGAVMTAKLVNPPSPVTGDVDATGCNIGVYFDAGTANAIDQAEIHGANYFGVVVNGKDTFVGVDIRDSTIRDIGETPFNGTQHGVAVYYAALGGTGTGVEGDVEGNTITEYQKGGIVVNGARAWVNSLANTVVGLGPVDFIAQNGIQYGFGANGTVFSNDISGNYYSGDGGVGPNAGGQNPPGWEYYSAGLLLYQPGTVKHSKNRFADNQHNLSQIP